MVSNDKKNEDEKDLKVIFTFGTILLSVCFLFIIYIYSLQLNNNELYNFNRTNITNITNITNNNEIKEEDFLIYYVMFGFFGYGVCVCSCAMFLFCCCSENNEYYNIKKQIKENKNNLNVIV